MGKECVDKVEDGREGGDNVIDYSQPLVYVSAYTDYDVLAHTPTGTEGDGIQVFSLNTDKAELKIANQIIHESNPNPAFMRFYPDSKMMYVVNERIDMDGTLFAYHADESGRLRQADEVDAQGRSTCYICRDKSKKWIMVANYWNATISVMKLHEDGSLGEVVDVCYRPGYYYCQENHPNREEHMKHRQGWSHTHCIVPDRSGSIYFVPDLGENCIHQYELSVTDGKLKYRGNVRLREGHGPRHFVFHPEYPVAFVANELDSTVDVLRCITPETPDGPRLEVMQTISAVPAGYEGKTNCAELRVGPTGRFLYVANRFSDTIATFAINREQEGMLTLVSIEASLGRTPRHFDFDPEGKLMVVANTDNDTVVVFHVDEATGMLQYSGNTYSVKAPNFVKIVDRNDLRPTSTVQST